MKKRWWIVAKLSLGIGIICLLVHTVGFSKLYETFKNIDIGLYLLFLLIMILTNFILGTLNISILISKIKKINFKKLLGYYNLSWAFGLFAPGKLGEFSIVYFLRKEGIGIGKGTAVSIIDKFITLIVLGVLSIIGFFSFFEFQDALKKSLIIVIGIIIFPILITNKKILGAIKKIIKKISKKFSGFSNTIKDYFKNNKKALVYNLIITSIKWITNGVSVFILFKAFGTSVSIISIILIDSVTLMVGLVPITINGMGIKQAVALFLFDKINVSYSVTLSVYIAVLITNYFLAALIVLFSRIKSKKQLG